MLETPAREAHEPGSCPSIIKQPILSLPGGEMDEDLAEPADITTALTELTALLLEAEDVEAALHHLARVAVAVIPDGPSCGIAIIRGGKPEIGIYHGEVPRPVAEAQYIIGDGPGLEAIATRSPVVVQNLADEQRWANFRAAALAAGVHGLYAHPLEARGELLGVLNLYAHEPGMFPEVTQRIAVQFVEPAALLLSGVLRRISQQELIAGLRQGMASRAVIDQAIGILMARHRCSPEQALARLRKMSNDSNVKLRDLAARLVAAVATGSWAQPESRDDRR
jgi:putative methionine-R-sulfoxide reductase with GAF domain